MKRAAALSLAVLLAVALAAATWARKGGKGARPHVVVLLWDTTRADRLGAYGHSRPTTPWLSGVAARGVLFEQCRTPAPWTVPSHASLFTGLLPSRHGAVYLESPLSPAHRTLAERLRDAGYDTVLVTANPLVGPESGLAQGFDAFHDVGAEAKGQDAEQVEEALARELAARKADAARAARPIFLFVNLMEPHLPYDPPEEMERPWRAAGTEDADVARLKRFHFPDDMAHNLGIRRIPGQDVATLSNLYDGEILRVDRASARIEALLAKEGLVGPGALLVVTSDHGENLGEGGLVDHKLSVAESLLRIPLVMHWPGRLEGGRRVPGEVRLQDLFPTILEAAGIPPAPGETPRAATLLGETPAARFHVAEFPPPIAYLDRMQRTFPDRPASTFEPLQRGLLAAVVPAAGGRRLKYVLQWRRGEVGGARAVGEALFDLLADPGEAKNLLAEPTPADRDAAARLRAMAEEWTRPGGD